MISGVGLAIAKTIGSGAIRASAAAGMTRAPESPTKRSMPSMHVGRRALQALGVRVLGVPALDRPASCRPGSRRAPVLTAPRESQPTIRVDARLHEDLRHRDAGRAQPDHQHAQVLQRRPVSLQALSSAASTTTAVPCWSSWKTGMSSVRLQPLLDLEAARRADVLEVDAAEARARSRVTVSTISSASFVSRQIGKASTPANSLKSIALPSMTGIAARGPDVAQAEDGACRR